MHICEQHEKHMMAACIIIQQIKIFLFQFKCYHLSIFFCFTTELHFYIQHFYRIDYIQTQGCQFITWTTYRYSVKHQNESTSSHKKI